ncbi:transposase [Anaerococcus cruorum]|uniref:transposase n=1 Tax=Anaerococcus sp. WGS1596 TaxID=3366806 RepID=UPI00372D4EFD
MPKYTKEFKIKLVLEYFSGQTGGQAAIANKYNISDSTLENWINKYNSGEFDNLNKKLNNNKYTSEFKLSVIQYRQSIILHTEKPQSILISLMDQ